MRNTIQRKAIQQVFQMQNRPLKIEDILSLARVKVKSLNQATVYRNLNRLIAEGKLHKVTHPELGTLFEKVNEEHRHHFHCRKCKQLFQLPGCFLDEAKHTPDGFLVEGHELFLFGICAQCNVGQIQENVPIYRG